MSDTYGLMADIHLHNWTSFSTVGADGTNTRLRGLLNEIERCAATVREAGGDTLVIAGDMFHVRGSISPSVLNPTMDCFDRLVNDGFRVLILAGNHDLEGKSSERLGSAVTALETVGCHVCNDMGIVRVDGGETAIMMVPWVERVEDLKAEIEGVSKMHRADMDLIIHAPIDGVIDGLPSHNLSPEYLAGLGFRRVFAGHYHNHKRFDGGVYSVGALAHHTWSDIGSRAGFLIVKPDEVVWRKSHLPEFIDLGQLVDLNPDDIPMVVDGNFVRIKIETVKAKDVEEARKELLDMGAVAVMVMSLPKPPAREGRAGAVSGSGESLEVSVGNYVKTLSSPLAEEIAIAALGVLASVSAV